MYSYHVLSYSGHVGEVLCDSSYRYREQIRVQDGINFSRVCGKVGHSNSVRILYINPGVVGESNVGHKRGQMVVVKLSYWTTFLKNYNLTFCTLLLFC